MASEASILVVSSSEIELLGPVSSVLEASVQSLSGLFRQSQRNCVENGNGHGSGLRGPPNGGEGASTGRSVTLNVRDSYPLAIFQ